jgi:hypothetical protein
LAQQQSHAIKRSLIIDYAPKKIRLSLSLSESSLRHGTSPVLSVYPSYTPRARSLPE